MANYKGTIAKNKLEKQRKILQNWKILTKMQYFKWEMLILAKLRGQVAWYTYILKSLN